MKVNFGKVYVQRSIRANEHTSLKHKAENLMLEGENSRYCDKDYLLQNMTI